MRLHRNRRTHGFTLIELLIVVAIIGMVAVILIPNLMDALQKAKQKRTLGTIRDVGTAWFSWLTDEVSSAAAGSNQFDYNALTPIAAADLRKLLIPNDGARYASSVPRKDSWGNLLTYAIATDLGSASQAIAVRSFGRDATEGPTTPPYPMGAFAVTEYVEDIVWSDGFFIRYPAGAQVK